MPWKQDKPSLPCRRLPFALWLLLLAVVVAGLGTKVCLDLDYQKRWNQYQQSVQQYNAAVKRHSELGNLGKGRAIVGLKPEEVEAILKEAHGITFDGPLVQDPSSPSHNMAVYIDPLCDTRVEVYFFAHNNKCAGAGTMMQTFPTQPNPPAKHIGQQWASKVGRWMSPVVGGMFLPIAYIVWIPLLVLYQVRPHRRSLSSVLVLGCAVLCPLLWLMASYSLLSAKGVMSYDANFWGLIMFVVTVFAIYQGGVTDRYPVGTCQSCGYSLKGNTSDVCPECGAEVESVAGKAVA